MVRGWALIRQVCDRRKSMVHSVTEVKCVDSGYTCIVSIFYIPKNEVIVCSQHSVLTEPTVKNEIYRSFSHITSAEDFIKADSLEVK